VVFDTEHLSALFERVIIASGTSNRQTKALAASVRDAVREAGFPKPRMEGETNGEWIIVDCAQAVVHIMQPNFRQYYHLEELWGEKPVRLKLGAAKPEAASAAKDDAVVTKGQIPGTLKRSSAAKKGAAEAFPSKAQVKKNDAIKAAAVKKAAAKTSTGAAPAKKTAAKTASTRGPAAPAKKATVKAPAVKVAAKTLVVKAPAKTVARVAAKRAEVRKPAAKKTVSRKA
jgi:ribosome-associated protein